MRRGVLWLAWASFAGIVVAWLVTCVLGDRFWWTVPFLYGPRWIGALLLAGMIPALASAPRRAWIPALLGSLVVTFGLLDVHLGIGRRPAGGRPVIRVMELNADGGHGDVTTIMRTIDQSGADIVVIAECGEDLKRAFKARTAFHFHQGFTSLCLFSRYPIAEWIERNPRDIWIQNGSGSIVRAVLATPFGPVRLGMVHLETPRDALQMFRDLSEIPKLGPLTNANIAQRDEESRLASEWMTGGTVLPTIVAGDFNLPVESAIYRHYWRGYRNAFSETGLGSGFTKHTRRWGARIDHILTSDGARAIRSFVGGNVGSDHLPLIADVALPSVSGRAPPGSR